MVKRTSTSHADFLFSREYDIQLIHVRSFTPTLSTSLFAAIVGRFNWNIHNLVTVIVQIPRLQCDMRCVRANMDKKVTAPVCCGCVFPQCFRVELSLDGRRLLRWWWWWVPALAAPEECG